MTPKHMGGVLLAAFAAAGFAACGESDGDDRGEKAIGLCREHGGVVALEDEIVICRDQTSQTIE